MKIVKYELNYYTLPLCQGQVRKGIYLTLLDEEGRLGIGEIAPLPGRSIESLDTAYKFAKELCENLLKNNTQKGFAPPSVLFGLDGATKELEGSDENADLQITKLITPPLMKEGEHLKIKIGHLSIEEAISFIKPLVEKGKKLHLDINMKWTLKMALSFCKHFSPNDFRYLEDPVHAFTDLEKFYDSSGFNFAVDEFLLYHPLERILTMRGLSHLIIKPTLFGGREECKQIVNNAKEITPVFSSANESEVGLRHIAKMAKELGITEPLGIDTLDIFDDSLSY